MKDTQPFYHHSNVDNAALMPVDVRELANHNLEKINEYLSSPIEQEKFLERQKKILSRPPHYLFDQSEASIAQVYIDNVKRDPKWIVSETALSGDMFSQGALGAIVEGDLGVDLGDQENRRKFSTTLVAEGIKRDKNILVVLRNLDQLDRRERPNFFDKLGSADMKAFGGPRERPGAHMIHFIGIGNISELEDVVANELFHFADEAHVTYDEQVAQETLMSMQEAFKQLESNHSAEIVSARNSGKSTALAALRQEFPGELYIFKLDKIIRKPEDVYRRNWVIKEGQIAVFDRAEMLDEEAKKFLTARFNTTLYVKSSNEF